MNAVPRSALLLALAGLLPFAWGALTVLHDGLAGWTVRHIGPRFSGPYVQLFYGAVILSFMSGVLWGFASKAEGQVRASGLALSVIPALWAFFMTGGGPESATLNLMTGFSGLLALDWFYWRQGLAPSWWLHLRVPITAGVLLCLLITILA